MHQYDNVGALLDAAMDGRTKTWLAEKTGKTRQGVSMWWKGCSLAVALEVLHHTDRMDLRDEAERICGGEA